MALPIQVKLKTKPGKKKQIWEYMLLQMKAVIFLIGKCQMLIPFWAETLYNTKLKIWELL